MENETCLAFLGAICTCMRLGRCRETARRYLSLDTFVKLHATERLKTTVQPTCNT